MRPELGRKRFFGSGIEGEAVENNLPLEPLLVAEGVEEVGWERSSGVRL